MTYDSPFWAIEEEVISEVLILKGKVWWPQKVEKEKNNFWKYVGPCQELNPDDLSEMPDIRSRS